MTESVIKTDVKFIQRINPLYNNQMKGIELNMSSNNKNNGIGQVFKMADDGSNASLWEKSKAEWKEKELYCFEDHFIKLYEESDREGTLVYYFNIEKQKIFKNPFDAYPKMVQVGNIKSLHFSDGTILEIPT